MKTNDLDYFKQKIYEIAKVPKSRLGKVDELLYRYKRRCFDIDN